MQPKKFAEFIEMEKSASIIAIFSTYIILKASFSEQNLASLRHFTSAKPNYDHSEGILNGFKLACVLVLDNYAQSIVDAPKLLGVEVDDDYYDYTHFTRGRGRTTARGSTRPGHMVSRLVEKANTLLFRIIGINNWVYIENTKKEVESFAESIRNIYLTYYTAIDSKGNQVDLEKALTTDSIDHMLINYTNLMPILHTYTNYYHDVDLAVPDYDKVFDEFNADYESRFDRINLISDDMPKSIPDPWALGYSLTLHEALKILAFDKEAINKIERLDKEVQEINNWRDFDRYSNKLNDMFGLRPFFGRHKYSQTRIPTSNSLQGILGEVKTRKSPERMLSILGNRARIVDTGSSGTAYLNFTCLLDGAIACSKRRGEKTRVALFIHKLDDDDDREDYSIGVFMPARGKYGLTNASRWWVFYSIGNNHSGDASWAMSQVMKKIQRNAKHIDRVDIPVGKDEFYKYCEDPGYFRLYTEIRSMDQMVSKLRGTYPELLIANMLTNTGYQNVKLRFAPAFLNKYEDVNGDLDVVGIKIRKYTTEIVVFESKGRARIDTELDEELIKFSKTVKALAENIDLFLKEFGANLNTKSSIKAYFVSMADLGETQNIDENNEPKERDSFLFSNGYRPKVPENITLWDFNDFQSHLAESGIPEIYRNLLKNMPIAISL